MKIADTLLRKELKKLYTWILKKDEKVINRRQEEILVVIYLITNKKFRERIKQLRKKYLIPSSWYKKPTTKLYSEAQVAWISKHSNNPPFIENHEDIIKLAKEFDIDRKIHGNFLIHYLYLCKVTPGFPSAEISQDEYKYKARIEMDFNEDNKDYNRPPNEEIYIRKGFIRFYKDTTPTQLNNFIKENWKHISAIQQQLENFPHPKKYGKFKRDIQIYLLSLLGYKPASIIKAIQKDNIPDKKEVDLLAFKQYFDLDEDIVRQAISAINQQISLKSVNKTA